MFRSFCDMSAVGAQRQRPKVEESKRESVCECVSGGMKVSRVRAQRQRPKVEESMESVCVCEWEWGT